MFLQGGVVLGRRDFLTLCAAANSSFGQENVRTTTIPLWDPGKGGEATLFDPTAPFTSSIGQPGWRGRVGMDLVERARLALTGTLTNHVRENGLPYFDVVINYATGKVSLPSKGTGWDHISQTGRSVNAILCARDMTGDWNTGVENEAKIRKVLLADFHEDGFNYSDDDTAMMHDQNRTLLALTNWFLHSEGEHDRRVARKYGDKLVAAFIRTARKQSDAWSMPGAYYSPQRGFYDLVRAPGNHGRTIMPLVYYARATGNSDALMLASHYANHVFNVSDSFRFDKLGNFRGFGDEAQHVHSTGATVSGLVLLGTELKQRDMVERGRAIYEYGLKAIGNNFGWIPESNPLTPSNRSKRPMLRQTTCEGCCITDYIEAAICLAQAGYGEYWAEAERYLRNHLMESQMTTADWVKSAGPVDMRPRILGGFSARSSPDRMFDLYHPSGPIGCCNAAGVRALHLAWKHGLEHRSDGVHVNLLFDRETSFAKVRTSLPARGEVTVTMKTGGDLYVRIPDWARHAVAFEPVTTATAASWQHGSFCRIADLQPSATVTLRFPLRQIQDEWLQPTMGISYRTEWLGDTVVAVHPPGNCFPLYERKYLL
jgi:hypothetical protein